MRLSLTHLMAFGRRILSSIFDNKNDSDQEKNFLENGSMFLEDLIAFSNGKYNSSIRRFSIQELSQATNGFCSNQIVLVDYFDIYEGSFDKCPILIKKHHSHSIYAKSQAIRDMVITSLMSSHENFLNLIGCCLDFDIPASVYKYAAGGSIELLSKHLYESKCSSSLTWKSRLKIANDIAYAIIYMHTAFSVPIIYRDLEPNDIIIDQSGVAKLLDFSVSISIPPGETQVEDKVVGTVGFIDPEYMSMGSLTEKSDVYSFGVILLELLTGKKNIDLYHDTNQRSIVSWVKDSVENDQFNEIVDPRILKERGGIEQEQQVEAVGALALRCTQYKKEDRPEMIDFTKELRQMLKSDCPSSSTRP
ncbi:Non-functional pseudokinase ZED1 [Camellia lanceoleosa]|uniref:Non-functional pseudokinase ZED1 n=1 Tax=Camellia lanceoleosa TaxID=1840588 RepID=A0ACC0J2Y2_9ERIC|nr:Non-functional pseudokinase ZED1 [Camellia lanceoleosa]